VAGRRHLRWRFGGEPAAGERRGVVLIGHFDTVWPMGTVADWPFAVDASAGTATGPGSLDMKAGIVQLFHALSTLDTWTAWRSC
jgi:glutamate carboxypeptidase